MPEKYSEHLIASFQPSESTLLTGSSNTQLLVENPILASALSQIFPYLLLIDNFLEIVTWTNDDQYQNFLMVVIYSCIVVYWNILSWLILPMLMAVTFSCLVWSISSVIYDSKYDEKPTIDEVLRTLYNITTRFEMLLRPVQHFPFKARNYVRIFMTTTLLTPLHVLLLTTIIPPQRFVWFAGLFVLTYHSPWSFSTRRLLWRSVYIRIITFYITGLDIRLKRAHDAITTDEEDGLVVPLLTDFKIIKKAVVSSTQLKQEVLFEILENERRWIGLGWSSILLPGERPNYCYDHSFSPSPQPTSDKFPFPMFENDLYTYSWNWADKEWKIDTEYNKHKSKDGWMYFDNSWGTPSNQDGFLKYTRCRRWVRKANLSIDKQATVYDE